MQVSQTVSSSSRSVVPSRRSHDRSSNLDLRLQILRDFWNSANSVLPRAFALTWGSNSFRPLHETFPFSATPPPWSTLFRVSLAKSIRVSFTCLVFRQQNGHLKGICTFLVWTIVVVTGRTRNVVLPGVSSKVKRLNLI